MAQVISLISRRMFFQVMGRLPDLDDLDRCNCDLAGKPGHEDCGWCMIHRRPVFDCPECAAAQPLAEKIAAAQLAD